jgi:hypothetical protein
MNNISEFTGKQYREFYSMNELVKTISKLIIVWSWGAREYTKMSNFLLRFRVSAHRHKGYVFVAVNGADLFDVWLTNLKGEIKKEFTDVYISELVSTIDDEIERIPEYEY